MQLCKQNRLSATAMLMEKVQLTSHQSNFRTCKSTATYADSMHKLFLHPPRDQDPICRASATVRDNRIGGGVASSLARSLHCCTCRSVHRSVGSACASVHARMPARRVAIVSSLQRIHRPCTYGRRPATAQSMRVVVQPLLLPRTIHPGRPALVL
jgi:hypothetical protein